MTPIRVLLVEDHDTVRQGLRLLIETQADMAVIGEAADGRAGVQRAAALDPDVVVMDVSMPELNGLAALRAIQAARPAMKVVMLTRYSDAAYVKELLGAGATGYVLKQSPSTTLLRAIRDAVAGRRFLDPTLAARSERSTLARDGRPSTAAAQPTARETEVLKLTALGHSQKEIAAQLDLSVKTVEVHKSNGMRKLGLRGRIDVLRYAMLRGWLHDV
jgi:DNA-binding NarL/FixJ family response regulator